MASSPSTLSSKPGYQTHISETFTGARPFTLPPDSGFSLNLNLTDLIDAQDDQGRTPVHYVTIQNDFYSLYLLAEKGANLDMADTDGRTALHIASKQGQLSMVDYLLEKRVWLEGWDKRGLTALHLAAMKGHTEAVRSMLRVAAQRGIRDLRNMQEDFYSRTSLHYAVLTVRLETVKALVEELGDGGCVSRTGKKDASGHLDILDHQGRTALHVACTILAQNQTQSQEQGQSHHEISRAASAIVGVLMDAGASLDIRDFQGRTALHLACAIMSRVQMQTREHGNTGHDINHLASLTVSTLVDAGAKLDIQDDMGCTPLMYAAQGAHLGAIRCLVDKDSNVDAVDGQQWTARDYAEHGAPQGQDRDEVLRILSPSRLMDPFLRLQ
ncbi:hypothetical protein SMACR_08911 [Sordaria macrospora]|uniref:WGS project CABT00000000 data, contig 2.69 n=2 Tax=Sordaria macrospora TaxID=5147 RepID=F7WB30_SORMK|nr:uncharacterized protein SMAC_08911 [Sordaria macrospora k-hell]KAA8628586.1 hypothetical protein SMACR_08911 [Sordaria macrospora]WPJ64040.1 hypothetical protein SMAC4_08911 [Sordaria macrospora]CCC14322.1 unnamed protein product [Sordaria macrospora k-hell]